MTTLPTAAALAVLVLVAGIGGVVAADPTVTPTAAPTVVENNSSTPASEAEPTTVRLDRTHSFEERLAHRLSQFDLTDEQIRTIVSEAARLREDGASRLVIRSSIVMNLYEYGVDADFLYAGSNGDSTPGERIAERLGDRFDLTDAQVDEIAATIDRMHAAGSSRAEIYRAVHALLVDFGVDEDDLAELRERFMHAKAHQLHERSHALHERAHRLHRAASHDRSPGGDAIDRRVDRLERRYDLTDEQTESLERLIRRMVDTGVDRDAIRATVADQLADWEVDRSVRTDRSRAA